jgi:hypothetical protein
VAIPPADLFSAALQETLVPLWVNFDDLVPRKALPVNPKDRKCPARPGASAPGQEETWFPVLRVPTSNQ